MKVIETLWLCAVQVDTASEALAVAEVDASGVSTDDSLKVAVRLRAALLGEVHIAGADDGVASADGHVWMAKITRESSDGGHESSEDGDDLSGSQTMVSKRIDR
jgi:hypothetical protein